MGALIYIIYVHNSVNVMTILLITPKRTWGFQEAAELLWWYTCSSLAVQWSGHTGPDGEVSSVNGFPCLGFLISQQSKDTSECVS